MYVGGGGDFERDRSAQSNLVVNQKFKSQKGSQSVFFFNLFIFFQVSFFIVSCKKNKIYVVTKSKSIYQYKYK